MYRYARGEATPKAENLVEAMRRWDLLLAIGNEKFGRVKGRSRTKKRAGKGVQLKLFEPRFVNTKSAQAELKLPPRGETLELAVKLLVTG